METKKKKGNLKKGKKLVIGLFTPIPDGWKKEKNGRMEIGFGPLPTMRNMKRLNGPIIKEIAKVLNLADVVIKLE
jgi:hypothetical protein